MAEIRNRTAALRANKRQGSIMTLCSVIRGGSRILGKGGSDKNIHNWGRSRDSKGAGGALIGPSVGSGAKPSRFFAFALI